MNKKIIISGIITLIAVAGIGYYIFSYRDSQSNISIPADEIPSLFNNDFFVNDEINLKSNVSPEYSSQDNKYIVSFNVLTGAEYRGANSTFDIYVNNGKAGRAGGVGVSMERFSPDNKFFSFRSRNIMGCAGVCQDFGLYVVDLETLNTIFIEYPSIKERESMDINQEYADTMSFIESYSWNSDNNIEITSYAIGLNKSDGELYRISREETRVFKPVDGSLLN
jgi:dipeptidyl aminopeptidase/acylaminoacyl peptidase